MNGRNFENLSEFEKETIGDCECGNHEEQLKFHRRKEKETSPIHHHSLQNSCHNHTIRYDSMGYQYD